jgi:integrase
MLRKCAREWQWLDRAPMVRMLKEPVRYLTHAEAVRLLAELPPHLRDMAAFSLESGLRAANVTGLKWSAVDLKRKLAWVHLDEAKARKAIPVPLNGSAMTIVQKQIGKHPDHVFRGWASYAMVQRYAHFAADHLAPWAERLVSLRDDRGTNPSQPADVPAS